MLHAALPSLEALHKAWILCTKKDKYAHFSMPLNTAAKKVMEYYNKTEDSNAFLFP
jgi:hypothetical protein